MSSAGESLPLDRLLAHREWVRRVARAMVRDENDADDIEQCLWLEALQRPPRSRRSPRGWLASVLRHDLIDLRRSETARARREEALSRGEAIPSAAELVAAADADRRVVNAVMDLAEPYRSTVLYRFFEDLPPTAIAERQGVPVETVRTRLKRALAQLRERFDAENEGDREKWSLALLPLLRRSLDTSGARGTAAAAAGAIFMGAKAKVVAALLTVVVVVAGALFWTSRAEDPDIASAPVVPKEPTPAVSRPPAPPTALQPVPTKFGIDGVTRVGETPMTARVSAWPVGKSSVSDDSGATSVLGLPWFEALDPPAATAHATSRASGEFSVHGLDVGTWLVVATFGDGRRAAETVELTSETPRVRVELAAVADGCGLHGRALHGDGTPFVGWIGARTMGRPRSTQVWVRSGATGEFAFAGLPIVPGSSAEARVADVFVEALQAGKTLARVSVELPHPDEVLLVVDASGKTRRGRVVAAQEDTPIAGARVLTSTTMPGGRPADGRVESLTTTAADGRFEFASSEGFAWISVEAEGFATMRVRDDGASDELVVRLPKRALLTGKVVRADDASPVAGATVHVASPETNTPGTSRATSDADGAFRLEPCIVGRIDVYVLGGGWASERLGDAAKKGFDPFAREIAPGSSSDLLLRVVPSGRVEGRVLDAKDQPVASVTVEARRAPPPVNPTAGSATRVVTQADGRFQFGDLVPGAVWTFTVRPLVGEPKSSEPTRLESGRTTTVDIRLDPAKRIAVTVLAADTGAPIANALISVATAAHGPWNSWSGPPTPWTTDANGAADVGPVGSSCTGVYVRAAGYVEGHVAPETVDDATLRAVVRLESGKPLTGRVVVPEGLPIERVRLCASERAGPTFTFVRPDASGAFRFDTLRDQMWDLRANAMWNGRAYRAGGSARSGDSGVVLTLTAEEEPLSIRVRVSDAQGIPLPAGVVSYVFNGAARSVGEVEVRSGVALVPLPSGPANGTLVVRPTPRGTTGSGTARIVLPDPLPREFDVRLPAELRITGRVIGPTGDGVEGVRVVAQPVNTGIHSFGADEDAHGTAVTQQFGDFAIGGLGALTYSVRCASAPGLAQTSPVEVRAGATGVEIRLSAAASATVTVRGPDGAPLGGCSVIVQLGSAIAGSMATASAGTAQITGLDAAAAYSLKVVPPSTREDLVAATITPWKVQDTTVQLEGGGSVSGIVRDDAGQAIPWATVVCRQGSRGWSVAAGRDGRFRVTGVRLDEAVRLRPQLEGEQDLAVLMPKQPDDLTARAGATDVVLVARAADVVSLRVEGLPDGVPTHWAIGTYVAGNDLREQQGWLRADGVLRIRGLDRSLRHGLFVGPTGDGQFALLDNLVVGGPEVLVRLTQGAALTGQIRGFVLTTPEGRTLRTSVQDMIAGGHVQEIRVTARGGLWSASASVDASWRFRFPGLPPEACLVIANGTKGGKVQWSGSVTARPGEDVTIEMEVFPPMPR